MMKKLILIGLLIPSLAFGQQNAFVRNDDNATTLNGANGRQASASVDSKGVQSVKTVDGSGSGETQSVIPVSNAVNLNGGATYAAGYFEVTGDTIEAASTTTVLNLTSHAARVGDVIVSYSGTAANDNVWSPVCATTTNTVTLCNALPTTPGLDGVRILRPVPATLVGEVASSTGTYTPYIAIDSSKQPVAATGILKLEDSAAASSDALVGVAGVVNTGLLSKAADGDYTGIALDTAGAVLLSAGANGPLILEDNTSTNGEAITKVGAVTNSALSASAATNGDWTWLKTDELGRTITTLAPAGESWQACTGNITTTAQTAIKAAVASNRIYVTSINCSNSGTASLVTIQDGSSTMNNVFNFANGVTHLTFPVPLRGTVNTALNVTYQTGGANAYCCASGYISVN